jgi:prepilin-type processing-associated H-X9-DG protein
MGPAAFTLLLPYLEQDNVYRLISPTNGFFSTVNMPNTNPAYSTAIKTYLCPSSPAPASLDYSAALNQGWSIYGAKINYPAGLIFGRTDYSPVSGTALGISSGTPESVVNGNVGIIAEPPQSPSSPTSVTDGLSNTIMVVEDGGRPFFYIQGGKFVGNGPVSQGGGAWADPFSAIVVNGSNPDGTIGGPCALDCTSDNEMFSFHTGGANFLFGDGHVQFISQSSMTLTLAAALISRAGGEVIPGNAF